MLQAITVTDAQGQIGGDTPLRVGGKIAARTVSALWDALGDILARFTPEECAIYLANAGYVPLKRNPL